MGDVAAGKERRCSDHRVYRRQDRDEDLGYWSRYGVEKVLLPLYRIPLDPKTANNDGEWDRGTYYKVDNGSFRQYRTVYGKGRDFFVHSDVRRLKLAQPVVVTVNP